MSELPEEIVDTNFVVLLEHEETLAFAAWKDIEDNAAQACGVIRQIQTLREEQEQRWQDEFPDAVSLPEKHAEG